MHRLRIVYVEGIEGLPRDVNLGLEFDSVLEVRISGEYGSCMPRDIYFRDDRDEAFFRVINEILEFLLRIIASFSAVVGKLTSYFR